LDKTLRITVKFSHGYRREVRAKISHLLSR
jgi:hypothetical protein